VRAVLNAGEGPSVYDIAERFRVTEERVDREVVVPFVLSTAPRK